MTSNVSAYVRTPALLIAVMAAVTTSGCSLIPGLGGDDGVRAETTLRDRSGNDVALAVLTQDDDGNVTVEVTTTRIPQGTHGIHFHAIGSCQGPEFNSAGAHFNPGNRAHGLDNPAGPHNGDLANLVVGASERASYRSNTSRVTLTPGETTLFDGDGTALVIHADADDQRTDPSGNSGARIACGVLRLR